MIEEARSFVPAGGTRSAARIGVTTRLTALPTWKQDADFLFVQVSFSAEQLVTWRETIEFDGPVFAGVLAPSSAAMARKLSYDIGQLAIPETLIEALDRDPNAGVDFACDLIGGIRDMGAFDGVHVIPVARYREVAARLERLLL
jgi:5,10-methylenetetrahydrofolate reductase